MLRMRAAVGRDRERRRFFSDVAARRNRWSFIHGSDPHQRRVEDRNKDSLARRAGDPRRDRFDPIESLEGDAIAPENLAPRGNGGMRMSFQGDSNSEDV